MGFALTGPWVGGQECTEADKDDVCLNIEPEYRATMIGGQNMMPTITWTAGPEGTQSYALVFWDLKNMQTHWAMWNIPATVMSVGPDSIPSEATSRSFSNGDWFGSGACANYYELLVYALSEPTFDAGGDQAAARTKLADDDGTLVLAKDFARVNPKAPCGN